MVNRERGWKIAALLVLTIACGRSRAYAAQASPPVRVDLLQPPNRGEVPTIVTISMYVTDVLRIDEADESFDVQGYLMLSWHDDRLIRDLTSGRKDTQQFSEGEIWVPPVQIVNQISFQRSAYVLDADDDGLVHYVQRFDAEINGEFSLRDFPFDTQYLNIVIQPFLTEDGDIIFASESPYSGVSREAYVNLAAWDVVGIRYSAGEIPVYGPVPEIQQVRFDVKVVRRYGFYIWKVFLPMLLMSIVPFCVFWVDPKEFDWQMKIPIATMLTLIAFEFAISRDLPRVPYVTLLDAVFLTCFLFVFLCVVEIVVVYWLQQTGDVARAERIHLRSRWAVPLGFFVTLSILAVLFLLPIA